MYLLRRWDLGCQLVGSSHTEPEKALEPYRVVNDVCAPRFTRDDPPTDDGSRLKTGRTLLTLVSESIS